MTLPRILDAAGRELTYASLSMSRSLEQGASQLQWTAYEMRSDLVNQVVKVVDGGAVRFTGFVEQVSGNALDGFSHSARSLTSTLFLHDAAGNELFKSSAVGTIVRALAGKVGVKVAESPTDRVQRFRLQKGEDLGRAMQRLAEVARFVVTDDAAGAVRAYRAPEKASTSWVEGQGTVTRSVQVELDFSEWRNEWVCRGQREVVTGDLDTDGAGQLEIDVATESPRPTRRILPNRSANSRADARNFVEWQAKKALSETVRLTVTHSRWPAEVGTRVRIKVPSLGIDEDFVIASLSLEVSQSAIQATASCVMPDVYSARPLRPRVEKRVSNWKVAQGVEVSK